LVAGGLGLNLGIDVYSLVVLAIGLAMDAFSVATVTGFSLRRVDYYHASRMSATFGLFHALMPLIGWAAGSTIVNLVSGYDHWVAFLLLAFVGGRMIYEAVANGETIDASRVLSAANLLLFSVAVSIDSLAVGLSFFLERIAILIPALIIGAMTALFTFAGLMLGNRTGKSFGRSTQILGGVILIGIGLRIVVTHLF